MIKHSQPSPEEQPDSDLRSESSWSPPPRRLPLWQAFVLPIAAIIIFVLLLEGGLALFGVKPILKTEDPFVGFASNVPLFIPSPGPKGQPLMQTAPNKLNFFNSQSFPLVKPPGTYRIFTLGGSTTYGRPYFDSTSFTGWLRELLPATDQSKDWQVINAGGISYASYREAHLMEELVQYQPDLFIIYTSHNEFLEERTYKKLRAIPPVVRSAVSLLARTRTWSAMSTALKGLGVYSQKEPQSRDQLAVEVNTILDRSIGPQKYTRDDSLKENVLQHFRVSLERMVALARSVNAQIIFVTPASNLKDCSPFKSEHTPGLDTSAQQRSAQLLTRAMESILHEKWNEALTLLETAVVFDPRHAELQYRLGQTLLALGRFEEAETALRLARDEDVCPLRALSPMRQVVTEIAEEQGVGLVDYVELLEKRMRQEKGFPIPGEELFLDHVHPTIEGHKLLAVALLQTMIDEGLVQPRLGWEEQVVSSVAAKIEKKVNKETQGQALANLARLLLWAGKTEDAARLAQQALDLAGEYRQIALDSISTLTSVYQRQGKPEHALEQLYSTLAKAPGAIELRFKLGEALLNPKFMQLEEAAANFLLVCQQMPDFAVAHQRFGEAMAKRDRPLVAYPYLIKALRLNPKNTRARNILDQIRPLLAGQSVEQRLPKILLDIYPFIAPRKIVQIDIDAKGRNVTDGIEVEFHENGRIKRFLDIEQGLPNGFEIIWDPQGKILSRVAYQQGKPVNSGSGQ